MRNGRPYLMGTGVFIALPLCLLLCAGCSKPDAAAPQASGTPSGGMSETGSPGGGPAGGRPGGGGRGGPVAQNASGADIYKAKCGCHGPDGKGGKAPMLTGVGSDADSKLTAIIHDGKGKMPAFGTQLSDAQIAKAVTYIKAFK
jgi:hypothetical protein